MLLKTVYIRNYIRATFVHFKRNILLPDSVVDIDDDFERSLVLAHGFKLLQAVFSVADIDECSCNPCLNGATCTEAVNSYTCGCVAGFTGTHCETGTPLINDVISLLSCCDLIKNIVFEGTTCVTSPTIRDVTGDPQFVRFCCEQGTQ